MEYDHVKKRKGFVLSPLLASISNDFFHSIIKLIQSAKLHHSTVFQLIYAGNIDVTGKAVPP